MLRIGGKTIILLIHTDKWRAVLARLKVNLTLEQDVAEEARELGLNMSRLAESAIAQAARQERNRLWRENNKSAIDSYASEVEQNGLPLAKHRTF